MLSKYDEKRPHAAIAALLLKIKIKISQSYTSSLIISIITSKSFLLFLMPF